MLCNIYYAKQTVFHLARLAFYWNFLWLPQADNRYNCLLQTYIYIYWNDKADCVVLCLCLSLGYTCPAHTIPVVGTPFDRLAGVVLPAAAAKLLPLIYLRTEPDPDPKHANFKANRQLWQLVALFVLAKYYARKTIQLEETAEKKTKKKYPAWRLPVINTQISMRIILTNKRYMHVHMFTGIFLDMGYTKNNNK